MLLADIHVADIELAGTPEKKEYEASPSLPARTGYLIPFSYRGEVYKMNVMEMEGQFHLVAVYPEHDKNSVVPKFVLSHSRYAILDKLIREAGLAQAQ